MTITFTAQTSRLTLIGGLCLSAALLGACSRTDADSHATVGQKIDSAIATTEAKADAAKAEMREQMDKAKESTSTTADKAQSTANSVVRTIDDAAITTGVNAELAKDPKLSALKIDVDTRDGRVSLSGSAPDSNSRERATRLASAVKGVVSVDNQLRVRG